MASKTQKSKFFRVAVEGATTDGRKIERNWLLEIAKNYNREKYAARVFIEHIRGYNPEMGFRCQGDVIAVKTETVEIAGEKKLALFAQIEPTEEFVAWTKKKQKIYSSIEVNPDFAGSGEAYLVGMGCTDSPASLGTEILEFAASKPEANPFTARKQHAANLFTAGELSEYNDFAFDEDRADDQPSLLDRVMGMFKSKSTTDDARYSDVRGAVEVVAREASTLSDRVAELASKHSANEDALKAAKTAIDDLSKKLDHTPNGDPKRPVAIGGSGNQATDC